MLKDSEKQKQARFIYYHFLKAKWLDLDGCRLVMFMLVALAEIVCCYAAEVLNITIKTMIQRLPANTVTLIDQQQCKENLIDAAARLF